MADKMMRVAGRSKSGQAKPFKVTEDGDLITFPSDRTSHEVLQDSQDSVSTGKVMDVSGRRSAIINVTGEFVGEIRVLVQLYTGASREDIHHVIDAESGMKVEAGRIIKKGVYVADISGFSTLITRVHNIEEGNVTVSVEAVTVPNAMIENAKQRELIDSFNKPRNVLLYAGEIEVGAGALERTTISNVSDYVMVYAVIRAGVAHNAEAGFSFATIAEGFEMSPPLIHAISIKEEINDTRYASDWIEIKGSLASVIINNKSDATQSYKVAYYGVR